VKEKVHLVCTVHLVHTVHPITDMDTVLIDTILLDTVITDLLLVVTFLTLYLQWVDKFHLTYHIKDHLIITVITATEHLEGEDNLVVTVLVKEELKRRFKSSLGS